jgi:hypothetical protein
LPLKRAAQHLVSCDLESIVRRNLYLGLFAAGISPFLINGAINPIIYPHPWLYWSFELLSWFVLPAIVFWLAVRKGGLRADEIGLTGRVRGKKRFVLLLVLCVVAGPFDLLLYSHVYEFFRELFPAEPLFTYHSIVPEHGASRVVVLAYLGLTAGTVEELYFRGLFFRISLFFPAPVATYLVCSPALFALIHWEGGLSNILATYIFGLVSAVVFVIIRNLWPLVVGHIYTDSFWYQ